MNPLNQPMYDLFCHLNTLNGLLFTLENQLKAFEKLYRDLISKSSLDISRIFSGASLVTRDLTGWTEEGFIKQYPSGKFISKGEEYFELIRVLLAHDSAWTVSQGYEAYDKFLKDILARFLLENQQLAPTIKVEKFESNKKTCNLEKTDISYWRTYLDYYYKKDEKLKLIRDICPDIIKAEIHNNRDINLTDWFAVVEELRHSATHSYFEIRTHRMKNWSKDRREILTKHISGNYTDQGYELNITREEAKLCLELFSEYSFQVYKFLSISRGYNWNILEKEKK